ncbi:unnamed protein product [Lactuca saligna]|uniref:Uncharacterized protein n=1 Tax=Lactuca saligna TaxID=75948 RepID=A0AA35UL27_LACSI|nr:unnamed protein product [Lactuca saligna]
MLKLLEKALIILSSLNTEKIEDGEEVAVEKALIGGGPVLHCFFDVEIVRKSPNRRWSYSSSHHDSQLLFAGTPIPPWFLIHADQSSQSSTIFCHSNPDGLKRKGANSHDTTRNHIEMVRWLCIWRRRGELCDRNSEVWCQERRQHRHTLRLQPSHRPSVWFRFNRLSYSSHVTFLADSVRFPRPSNFWTCRSIGAMYCSVPFPNTVDTVKIHEDLEIILTCLLFWPPPTRKVNLGWASCPLMVLNHLSGQLFQNFYALNDRFLCRFSWYELQWNRSSLFHSIQTIFLFFPDMIKGMFLAVVIGPPVVVAIILIVQIMFSVLDAASDREPKVRTFFPPDT